MKLLKLRNILAMAAAVVAVAATLAACGNSKKSDKPEITTVYTDPSFENVVNDEVNVFEYIYKDANVIPMVASESECIDSLLAGSTRAIVVSRELTEKEQEYLKSRKYIVRQHKIAVDAIAIIVNPENPVDVLSLPELAEILSGKYTKWGDIEPTTLGDITVVFDKSGSSTVKYMRDSLLNGGNFGPNVGAQGSPMKVFDFVAENKNAIGIVGVNWISTDLSTTDVPEQEKIKMLAEQSQSNDTITNEFSTRVKVLKIRGKDVVTAYKPYQYYIYTGDYPLYRPVYMIVTGANGTMAHKFYSFVTGTQGQKLIQSTGILPAIFESARKVELK